jgi:predicted transposase YbfD/YdcC
LNRLGERDGEALVRNLTANAALPSDIVADIVERTDGVPLFVEELTKAVLESAARDDRVAAILASTSLTALSVPATLHASLMARLDRLGPATKEIAQIGAVLGREFGYELIELVARRSAAELQAALGQLGDAELLFCRGAAPNASYLFRHALVQDAAYSTLLRGPRQELHARVAAALEAHFADLIECQPELLAHHLTAAGDTERAIDQWLRAGQHAAAHFVNLGAIAHLERGLGLLRSLPESPARNSREIALQLALGLCLYSAKGPVAGKPPYSRTQELAESGGDTGQVFEALYGVWQTSFGAGEIAAASPLSGRLLDNFTDRKAAQLQHAFDTGAGMVLAHIDIDEKSNEIPAAQRLLGEFQVAQGVITLDALYCQKKYEAAAAAQAQIIVQLKDNQPTLVQQVAALHSRVSSHTALYSAASDRPGNEASWLSTHDNQMRSRARREVRLLPSL